MDIKIFLQSPRWCVGFTALAFKGKRILLGLSYPTEFAVADWCQIKKACQAASWSQLQEVEFNILRGDPRNTAEWQTDEGYRHQCIAVPRFYG